MKVIILLAVICAAYADHPGHEEHHDPCLHACREAIKAKTANDEKMSMWNPDKMMSQEGRAKHRAFWKKYIDGTAKIPVEAGSAEKWSKMCQLSTEAETCINACPDSPKKEGAKKFLGMFKLGCDEDFKSSAPCVIEVFNTPSDACKTKCQPLTPKISEWIANRDAHPEDHTPPPKDVLEAGCKFIHCKLNCRHTDIVNKCQEKGYETAKKFLTKSVGTSKYFYKRQGGDLTNWPDVCTAENIVKAD
jgi:hypothetical protein